VIRAVVFIIVVLLGVPVGEPLMAHSWYAPACCSGQDCAPLPKGSSVEPVRGGYAVRLEPDGDPIFFPHEKVRPSQDGDWHACINPVTRAVYCLYVPTGA
jgi:hypothetical protein